MLPNTVEINVDLWKLYANIPGVHGRGMGVYGTPRLAMAALSAMYGIAEEELIGWSQNDQIYKLIPEGRIGEEKEGTYFTVERLSVWVEAWKINH